MSVPCVEIFAINDGNSSLMVGGASRYWETCWGFLETFPWVNKIEITINIQGLLKFIRKWEKDNNSKIDIHTKVNRKIIKGNNIKINCELIVDSEGKKLRFKNFPKDLEFPLLKFSLIEIKRALRLIRDSERSI